MALLICVALETEDQTSGDPGILSRIRLGPKDGLGGDYVRLPVGSRATRRKVGCSVHAETGWLQELPITQFKLTGCRRLVEVAAARFVW